MSLAATGTLALHALGVDIDVECVGPRAAEAFDALALRWELCARATPGNPGKPLSVEFAPGADLRAFLVNTTHQVTHRAISENIGRLLMFHAAGVSNPETGATAVFVAPGGTGKTTICRELAPGRGYVSDETIGVIANGAIAPYPKPLSVRRDEAGFKDEIAPRALGLQPPTAAPYVEALLVLERADDGPQIPLVEQVDPFHAVTLLAPETSSLDQLPRPLHLLVDVLSRLSLLARVRYREALSLEPMVTRLIGPPR